MSVTAGGASLVPILGGTDAVAVTLRPPVCWSLPEVAVGVAVSVPELSVGVTWAVAATCTSNAFAVVVMMVVDMISPADASTVHTATAPLSPQSAVIAKLIWVAFSTRGRSVGPATSVAVALSVAGLQEEEVRYAYQTRRD